MRRSSIRPVVATLLATGLLAGAPVAQAGGPNSPVMITTGQVLTSESSGEPIPVDPGAWLLFRTGFAVTDDRAEVLDTITFEIELDGEILALETAVEDTPEATILWAFASSNPLSPGSVHVVTYRHFASSAGEDGFGNSWGPGLVFEATGTLVAGNAAAPAVPTDPFTGGWLATDSDGSQWAYFIEAPVDGTYRVESYDHGGSVCGDPGSRSPGPSGDPTEPVRFAGIGLLDPDGALAWDFGGLYCLDAVLGPYRVMLSDVDSETPPEEDGPITGSQRLLYDPATDTIEVEADGIVFERIKASSVEELRQIIEKAN